MSPLALGIGAERGVAFTELETLVRETLGAHGLADRPIACIASLDNRRAEPALLALAAALNVPTRFYDAATLRAEAPRLANPSARVEAAVGVPGVAEAAALAAAGPDSVLLAPKTKSAHATCAAAGHRP